MIKQILKPTLFLFVLHVMCVSCTKEVDFNQINDLEINPVIESSLFYFDAVAGDFVIGGSGEYSTGDFVIIDIFNNEFVNDNLVKAEFLFETVNSINRAYEVQVDFFDDFNPLPLHTFTFSTAASITNDDLTTQYLEVFEGNALTNLKQTTKLAFTLTMLSGTPINSSTPGKIHLESKGTFYLNIER